jgi:membrane protein
MDVERQRKTRDDGGDGWPGARARSPRGIPGRGWLQIAQRVRRNILADNLPLMSAALAFFGMLSLFPFLIAAITVYGLVADAHEVQKVVELVTGQLSGGAGEIIAEQLAQIVATSPETLTWGLVFSLGFAVWSASTGMLNLLKAVNLVYGERTGRGFLRARGLALAMTVGAVLFIAVAVALIAVLPAILGLLGLGATSRTLVTVVRWPVLLAAGMSALAIIYMLGPDRRSPRLTWVTWGSVIAVTIWLLGSYGFSVYVQNFGRFNETYGSLGSVVVLLMWFFLTSFSILLGAEINAEIELQTGVDSTRGPDRPRGRRGAVRADRTPFEVTSRLDREGSGLQDGPES